MKKNILLALLLSGSLSAQAQGSETTIFTCLQPAPSSTGGRVIKKSVQVVSPVSTPVGPSNAVAPGPGPGTQVNCSGVLNVNVHFVLRLNGTGNFNETDDGTPYRPWNALPTDPDMPADTAMNGYARAKALVAEMNSQAATNPLNGRPAGTSNPPKGFTYALNGVYFHRVGPAEFNIVKSRYQGVSPTACSTTTA